MPRRERWSIIGGILDALEQEAQRGAGARASNVALRANLSYERLLQYFEDLERTGLVTMDRPPRLTEKGEAFLRAYRAWSEILERFGLGPASQAAGRPADNVSKPAQPRTHDETTAGEFR